MKSVFINWQFWGFIWIQAYRDLLSVVLRRLRLDFRPLRDLRPRRDFRSRVDLRASPFQSVILLRRGFWVDGAVWTGGFGFLIRVSKNYSNLKVVLNICKKYWGLYSSDGSSSSDFFISFSSSFSFFSSRFIFSFRFLSSSALRAALSSLKVAGQGSLSFDLQ